MIATLLVTCCLAGLYLCWLSARHDDRTWQGPLTGHWTDAERDDFWGRP